MKSLGFFLFFLLANSVCAQVTFIVDELPDDHDFGESVYISGNFEGWTGGQDKFKLTKEGEQYQITLTDVPCNILFKFTLGSWSGVEMDENGVSIENRTYSCEDGEEAVYISVGSWTGNEQNISKSTAHKNVQILTEDFKILQLDRNRRIWIYLPPDYETSNKNYPVLYIHDGQNVFDVKTSYAGEWEVDETLNRLFYEMGLSMIVVAIDNAGEKRVNEYIPYTFPRIDKSEGKEYTSFIVETLKPHIDENFRTLKNADNTALMGSSLGGLITHYAALKYPDVFGKAGVFSPSFWVSEEAYDLAREKSKLEDTRMYFLMGEKEGETMVPDMERMVELMEDSGFNPNNLHQKIVEDGQHNEKLWREHFEEAILWLFDLKKPVRSFESLQETINGLTIKVSDGMYHIVYYTPEIVETTFIPKDQIHKEESHAVVLEPKSRPNKIKEDAEDIEVQGEGLDLLIQKRPFQISYYYKGNTITSENRGYHKTEYGEAISLDLTQNEILFGGGSRALGMNRRGHRLRLYNQAHYGYEDHSLLMNFNLPVVVSSKKYMVHFDNAPIGYLDLDSKGDNTLTYETISGRKTYQVIVGESWEDLINNYTVLTGKQPMLPRWALGNFSSRFGYHSEVETEETIQKFKEENIPVDAIILDLYWFGKEVQSTMGNLEVYRDSFPDFEGMVKRLKQKGVKTIPITEPFVLTTSKRWNEAVEKQVLATDSIGNPARYDFFFGNTGIIDIYKKEAENWFWNIYKDLADKGVSGVWGDLGEPEVHPGWVQHHTGSADVVHNTYGHDWARLVYEGYDKDFPNQRPFILMRAGYSGSQRYGMVPWSGDVNRTWGGLQSQTEIALQMGLQGLGYMHSDLGGFAGANLDDELYTRWLQYGVFQPIYRPHAQEEVPSEPVFRESKTKALAKLSIELRYRLLPYNYNLVFENNQKGTPLMRPLFFEEESDSTFNNASTYFWGSDFLVSPIMESGLTEKEVYFPKNNIWFDFYSDEIVAGGQAQTVPTQEESIPIYVRAGAFIPMVDVVQTIDDYALTEFDLHYYYHNSVNKSERSFYNDDGLTKNAFEKGMYEILEFGASIQNNTLEIEFEAELGVKYKGENKSINLILHNIDVEPLGVKVGRKKFKKFSFDKKNQTVIIPVNWNTAKTQKIKITLNK